MDNKSLHDNFRHQFTNVHALTVLTVSVFEIIGYIVLVLSGVEFFSLTNRYLWNGVIFPILVNMATHTVARFIVHNPKIRRKTKNTTIIVAALITSLVVAVIHREYIVTSCAFIFPIILSAMFNDKKLLLISFWGSVFVLSTVGLSFWHFDEVTLTTAINLFVLFGFLFISYLCGAISINFSKQNYTTIETQARQNNKLLQDVLRDQMTGLFNHNAFVTQLDKHITAGAQNTFSLVMIDVDNFKSINDTYGHDCGDAVLVELAQTIRAHCGKDDAGYRYGGEEFAVLFMGKTAREASRITQKILNQFKSHTFSFTEQSITFSAGVAQYAPNITRDSLFELADQTLYRAKREGRNRVLIAQEELLCQ